MTEIDLLKRLRDDVPAADPLALARARQQLFTPAPVRRRAPRTRLLVAGGLALTLAGGFLAADVVNHNSNPLPGTVADASTFLADAASLSNANPDAPIPPGHYRQVTYQLRYIYAFGNTPDIRATVHTQIDQWRTADPTKEYPQLVHKYAKVDFETPAAEVAAHKLASDLFEHPKPRLEVTSCGGISTVGNLPVPNAWCKPSWRLPTAEFLARQPRDPDALLAALRTGTDPLEPTGPDPDHKAFRRIGTALGSGLAPADLRAALYQAARKIPGIQLLDDVVTLDGRHGGAIGLVDNGFRQDIIISPSTGETIGYRVVVTPEGPGKLNGSPNHAEALRPGDILYATSFTTRITATAPPVR
jgi:hypothetical protein